jgi:hypothetical protein
VTAVIAVCINLASKYHPAARTATKASIPLRLDLLFVNNLTSSECYQLLARQQHFKITTVIA